jgi:hypothetical protein
VAQTCKTQSTSSLNGIFGLDSVADAQKIWTDQRSEPLLLELEVGSPSAAVDWNLPPLLK